MLVQKLYILKLFLEYKDQGCLFAIFFIFKVFCFDKHLVIQRCGILCQINGEEGEGSHGSGARDWEKKRGKRLEKI